MLNLHQLEVFYVVAQSRTFGEAAEKLYISQPAVSQHIKALEVAVGTRLFERSRRGISLTLAGRTLLEHTRDILRRVAIAENAVTNVANLSDGKTNIGATPNISSYLLPEWIRGFREKYPKLTPSVQTDVTSRTIGDVLAGQLNLGLVEGEIDEDVPDKLRYIVLQDVPQHIVVGRLHDWWERESVSIHELAEQPFVMRQQTSQTRIWLNDVLQAHGIVPRVTGEFDNPEAIKHATMTGRCVTILPEYAIQKEADLELLHIVRVADIELRRELKLVWDGDRVFPPVTRAFVSFLEECLFPQLGEII